VSDGINFKMQFLAFCRQKKATQKKNKTTQQKAIYKSPFNDVE